MKTMQDFRAVYRYRTATNDLETSMKTIRATSKTAARKLAKSYEGREADMTWFMDLWEERTEDREYTIGASGER